MVHTKNSVTPDKVFVTLNDLAKINSGRIECYNQAISYAIILNTDHSSLFKDIIAKCSEFNENLLLAAHRLDRNPGYNEYAPSFIYRAWADLKVAFRGNTQDALLNSLQYNEEVTQLAYKAALNVSAELNSDCHALIEEQHAALKCILASLKKCHGVRPYSRLVETYFN